METVAIVFASKHGTTQKVAKYLASKVKGAVLFDLKKNDNPDLSQFSKVVVGGPIYAGKLNSKVAHFCRKHTLELLQRKLTLFICGMNVKAYQEELEHAFPEILIKHAATACVVGGEFNIERLGFFERFLVRKISGVTQSVSQLDYEKLNSLAGIITSDKAE